jgi:hypothetical protein
MQKLITLAVSFVILTIGTTAFAALYNETVEGNSTYFSTGESYPSAIQMAGYNSRDKKLFVNLTLETTKNVTNGADFTYGLDVFNGSSSSLLTSPFSATVSNSGNATTATDSNKTITLNSPLTAAHRIVVTVTNVTLLP